MTGREPGGYPANIDNPDDWAAFLARYVDNRVTNGVHDGIGLIALHIVDAIEAARGAAGCPARSATKSEDEPLLSTNAWRPEIEARWIADCRKWRGKVLSGIHRHWCDEWDGLPVDETCPEWPCGCFDAA